MDKVRNIHTKYKKKADSWQNRSIPKVFINLWNLTPICENKGIYLSFLIEIENLHDWHQGAFFSLWHKQYTD